MLDTPKKIAPQISKEASVALARILWRTWKEVPGAEVPDDWRSAKPHFVKEARKLAIAMERNGMSISARDAEPTLDAGPSAPRRRGAGRSA